MKKNNGGFFYLNKIAQGVILSLVILSIFFTYNRNIIVGQVLLYETMPNYKIGSNIKMLFKFDTDFNTLFAIGGTESALTFKSSDNEEISEADYSSKPEEDFVKIPEDDLVYKPIDRIEDVNVENDGKIMGLNDVIYQAETDTTNIATHFHDEIITAADMSKLRDLEYLRNKFYTVDKRTKITEDLFDADEFLEVNLTIDNDSSGPKILIFHTHSTELYSDSKDSSEGVVGVGERLREILQTKYNIESIHDSSSYDMVDGKTHILGAYERMEPSIRKILQDNPSIEIVIDLHRDGVPESTHLVQEIYGRPTAQLMFFNGLTKIFSEGSLQNIASLPNPYLKTNLAMSFQMQLTANTLYPGLTRKVYLNAYRYSLHMLPKSMLVEVGAQTNTKEEAFNAMEPLADILAAVITK